MADVLATALIARLGCRLPVIQTAMGWVAKPELVAATSNAGAFGFLACAVMTPPAEQPSMPSASSARAARPEPALS